MSSGNKAKAFMLAVVVMGAIVLNQDVVSSALKSTSAQLAHLAQPGRMAVAAVQARADDEGEKVVTVNLFNSGQQPPAQQIQKQKTDPHIIRVFVPEPLFASASPRNTARDAEIADMARQQAQRDEDEFRAQARKAADDSFRAEQLAAQRAKYTSELLASHTEK